ncbi:ST3GAL3 isoform 19 [Pan troglodytes]|uniref:Isoform E3+32 of CMP-N-acetylneuraminate-beta-1,4-galactoside alpha-2,3-sialyltransferase n=2 Tax=Homininae TaxID=207598 RepID=Q11203-26|nr:alpha 2,3-sialyltransferase III type E3+32 [Homo sapiens]KAI2516695.1 ST3 beta-galactoside alpha-2,3-sialyltransferase 3 [Homo sapiens]KAI4080259.1 ST3 beta-galactoside alpha-2,3-sialyltransferase 3 [Homo sapiens]PNI52695.1 ST3GAL3 isoform 19 [Pan troglodytes]
MGLLVFVRNLLLALCLFLVLGFLYYSAWKLHLLQWEEDSSSPSQHPCSWMTPFASGLESGSSCRLLGSKVKTI